MNLNQLWSGSDYAYYPYRRRGVVFQSNARRVRVIKTYGEILPGNERETGFADVLLIDEEGEPLTRHDGTHSTDKIRARDIAMRWDQYEEERADYEAEQAERKAWYEKERLEREERWRIEREAREERERIERERLRLELAEKERIRMEKELRVRGELHKLGITNDMILELTPHSIKIDTISFMEVRGESVNG